MSIHSTAIVATNPIPSLVEARPAVTLTDLFGLGLPGSMTITGNATHVVDSYRSQP